MSELARHGSSRALIALLFALPALHPLFIPMVGPPSHLLWFVHVLPVALLTFHLGRQAAGPAVFASGGLVALGEAMFGAGRPEPRPHRRRRTGRCGAPPAPGLAGLRARRRRTLPGAHGAPGPPGAGSSAR